MLFVWTVDAFVRRPPGQGGAPFDRDRFGFIAPGPARECFEERRAALITHHDPEMPLQYVRLRRHLLADQPAQVLLAAAMDWPCGDGLSRPAWATENRVLDELTDRGLLLQRAADKNLAGDG